MKWTYVVQQKVKAALLLGVIMLLVGLTNVLERRNVEAMDRTSTSIYNDRLIPATDIFYMTENLYNRRLLIEEFLYAENSNFPVETLSSKLSEHEKSIDKLVDKYSKTFLVEKESAHLKDFKKSLKHYNGIEKEILTAYNRQSKEQAQKIYAETGKKDLIATIDHLRKLTEIQSAEGLAMIHGTQNIASNSSLVLTLQIVVAIVIGFVIQALIMASDTTKVKTKNFNLN